MKGSNSTGKTFLKMINTEAPKDIDSIEASPIVARNSGDNMATDRLLINEKAAIEEIFPPNMPVMIGAEAAVGASTQIIAAWASMVLNLKKSR
jgi:hypothetical protein